jgi:hypothetical protein
MKVSAGFDDVNVFVRSLQLDQFRWPINARDV